MSRCSVLGDQKNFKNLLARAKVRLLKEERKGMFDCGMTRCKVCKFVKMGDQFTGNVERQSFSISHSFSCDSQGVVYLMTCKKCGKQYVGSTITALRERFNNHNVRDGTDKS